MAYVDGLGGRWPHGGSLAVHCQRRGTAGTLRHVREPSLRRVALAGMGHGPVTVVTQARGRLGQCHALSGAWGLRDRPGGPCRRARRAGLSLSCCIHGLPIAWVHQAPGVTGGRPPAGAAGRVGRAPCRPGLCWPPGRGAQAGCLPGAMGKGRLCAGRSASPGHGAGWPAGTGACGPQTRPGASPGD